MSKLVKLEKMLERGFDRLRHPETPRELIEAIPDVLDDVEDHIEPSGGRGRVFPYQRMLVAFRVASGSRPAARALFQDLPERIHQRLKLKGCAVPADLEIAIRYAAEAGEEWGDRLFRIRYQRKRPSAAAASKSEPAPHLAVAPVLRLTVLKGKTSDKDHALRLARINLGRLEKVASTSGKGTRKNHVWFAAGEDTVSRAHAHIERDGADYHLFDDGSASGTRVLRDGDEFDVMPNASRGVRLKSGDRIELGKGCVVEVVVADAE